MASIIKIKRNNTGGTVPSGGDLAAGELAVNTADGLLFTSSNGSDIVSLGQTSASIQEAAALANTNSRIGTVESATTTAAIQATAALANTNAYIADVKTDSASWNDSTDTITFTRGDSTTYSVALTGFPSDSVSNTYVQLLLSNTNTFIGTKLDSSSYTTADVQTKAALANTNTFIGTKLDSSSYTTADVQTKAALANTNSAISGKQDADADTAKTDVVQTFSVAQRGAVTDHGSLIANTAFRQDFSLSNHFKMTLAGNITLNNPTNQVAGQSGAMEIINGGSYTVSFGSDFDFAAGTPPTITASGTDVLSYYVSSANNIVVDVIQNLS
jgi:hypothetical protein